MSCDARFGKNLLYTYKVRFGMVWYAPVGRSDAMSSKAL